MLPARAGIVPLTKVRPARNGRHVTAAVPIRHARVVMANAPHGESARPARPVTAPSAHPVIVRNVHRAIARNATAAVSTSVAPAATARVVTTTVLHVLPVGRAARKIAQDLVIACPARNSVEVPDGVSRNAALPATARHVKASGRHGRPSAMAPRVARKAARPRTAVPTAIAPRVTTVALKSAARAASGRAVMASVLRSVIARPARLSAMVIRAARLRAHPLNAVRMKTVPHRAVRVIARLTVSVPSVRPSAMVTTVALTHAALPSARVVTKNRAATANVRAATSSATALHRHRVSVTTRCR
ncbi:MAG: hypothetical protein H6R19_515 [Proteobacteria bacterium]|nr:hypothetical protein [Pseudomonadota bacterium]